MFTDSPFSSRGLRALPIVIGLGLMLWGQSTTRFAWAQQPGMLANEGKRFKVDGTQVVRYGAQSSWVEKTVTLEGECTNSFFGQDPLVGIKKTCELTPARLQPKDSKGTSLAVVPVSPPKPPQIQPATWGNSRSQARIFISGHSLTDDPYGEQVVQIANSKGTANSARFNQQIGIGSPIRVRTGMPRTLDGYSIGKNRTSSSGMNVLEELKSGRTIGGDRYDTLILTENHNLLEMLQWESTIKQVRHFHDRLVESNPSARTFFHASWWEIDKARPHVWAHAERTIALGWQCVGSRVNRSLELGQRSDRIVSLPISLAIVGMVDLAINGGLSALGARNTREALNLIFRDNVHLTQTGTYYAALVSYAAVFERSPLGAWHPPDISGPNARWLQNLAWTFTSNYYSSRQEPTVDECLTDHMPKVCESYWDLRGQSGQIEGCKRLFDPANRDNPLRFSPTDDSRSWFPARP